MFWASKKGGRAALGLKYHAHAAVLAGYRKALVSPGLVVSLRVSTNNRRYHFSAFLGAPFGHCRQFLIRRTTCWSESN